MGLHTPILFCIYNRPEVTRRVFKAIAKQQPNRLLVVGDGPKDDSDIDLRCVVETRAVLEQIDWDCDLSTNFADTNLGCKHRMASGITWGFEREERLIIIEDDCLPGESFFPFCEKLLDHYADDQRVMMISGDNFQPRDRQTASSYYFSKWAHIWGWASWRRAWNLFDVEIKSWPRVRSEELLRAICENDREYDHWANIFSQQYEGKIDTWDFPWMYACWMNQGLTILPHENLVSNIGFGPDATHTTASSPLQNLPVGRIAELHHPEFVIRNQLADLHTLKHYFLPSETRQKPKLLDRIFGRKQAA